MLYVMLVGAYPFERPEDKHDNQKLQKMIQVSAAVPSSVPESSANSPACQSLSGCQCGSARPVDCVSLYLAMSSYLTCRKMYFLLAYCSWSLTHGLVGICGCQPAWSWLPGLLVPTSAELCWHHWAGQGSIQFMFLMGRAADLEGGVRLPSTR
jgi:hypothetical protein